VTEQFGDWLRNSQKARVSQPVTELRRRLHPDVSSPTRGLIVTALPADTGKGWA
jgi:hypothetical protein